MVTGSRIERKKYEQEHKQRKKRPSSPNKKTRKKHRHIIKTLIIFLVTMFTLLLVAGGLLFGYYASNAPEIQQSDLVGSIPTKIYDQDGQLIKELGGQNRDLMTSDEIPQVLKDAVLAIEDSRFYSHNGIDPIRIAGAFVANLRSGGIAQGGSTITQQLVKLSVFSTDFKDQTLERKAQEAWLSLKLEREYSKDEILTMYLNKLFYSNNTYGAKTAAKQFFNKNIADITIAEAALLAGIPQAPTHYDPYTFAQEAKSRRDLVLKVELDRGLITQAQYDEAVNTSIDSMLQPLSAATLSEQDLIIDAYLTTVAEEVKRETNFDIYTDGIEVYTNLNMTAQTQLYETVNHDDSIGFPNDSIQTAVSVVDVKTGKLVAVIGGRKQEVAYGFNRATSNNRSIGSTMKPLSDYGPAIEYLNYSTGTNVVDEPHKYSNGSDINNYDHKYLGNQTIREALVGSRNIPALKVLQAVGLDNAYAFLQKLGITIENDNKKMLVESNAIGGEVSPVALSGAYAAISNYGKYTSPYTVTKIVTSSGTEHNLTPTTVQAMKDSTAYMLVDMLKGVPSSFAPTVQIDGLPQAGKTGTTNYTPEQLAQIGLAEGSGVSPDSWYAGITTNYAIATWVGYDNPVQPGHQIGSAESLLAQNIYRKMMVYLNATNPASDWTMPNTVEKAVIEKYTDPIKLVGDYTPTDLRSEELFVKGATPKTKSENFGKYIEPPTSLDANYDQTSKKITANWSGNLAQGTQYQLQVNGSVVYSGTNTTFEFSASELKDYVIVLYIVSGTNSSDGLSVTISLESEASSTEESIESSESLAPELESSAELTTLDTTLGEPLGDLTIHDTTLPE